MNKIGRFNPCKKAMSCRILKKLETDVPIYLWEKTWRETCTNCEQQVINWHKGKDCPYKPGTLCQENYCKACQIYLDWKA